jgi:hypothetical protein
MLGLQAQHYQIRHERDGQDRSTLAASLVT